MKPKIPNFTIYDKSPVSYQGSSYFIARRNDSGEKFLGVSGDTAGFTGSKRINEILLCPLTAENAAAIRRRLPWLNPTPLGRQTSFGFGDRLGSATPGHIQSLRKAVKDKPIAPIFAQQSVRENTRTGRTPQQVMDFAMWGILQEGWQTPWGADADHVKEIADLLPFVKAGYTFYTIDPSDQVDNEAQTTSLAGLREKAAQIPWDKLDITYDALLRSYCQAPVKLADLTLIFDEEILLRALVKYGRAIAHSLDVATALNRQMPGQTYDLELSVDETDTPTSIHEHYFIANELLKRDVPIVSLAPRFVGKFQKGVDYMGNLAEFEAELSQHVAILRHFDSYKLSIHTGSDKFSIYSLINKHAQGYIHVKTAGTSYLEALRVIAKREPGLLRDMLDLARSRFEQDRKSYYIDGQLSKVPANEDLRDSDLPGLFEQFDARQVLHVTFGSILDQYGDVLQSLIASYEEDYRAGLEKHFARHLAPFCE
jgi:hypothetical protein